MNEIVVIVLTFVRKRNEHSFFIWKNKRKLIANVQRHVNLYVNELVIDVGGWVVVGKLSKTRKFSSCFPIDDTEG